MGPWVNQGLLLYGKNIQCVLRGKCSEYKPIVESVNIFVILIGLVLIFKNEISSIVSAAFNAIKLNSEAIVK